MVRVLRCGGVALVLGLVAVGCLASAALAADSAYWTAGPLIRVGSLNGSGSPQNYASENNPQGVAIDPAAGKIYWTAGSAIRVGNLDGSGSPQNLGANYGGESFPRGVAIDPAAGKVYWANWGSLAIRVGNLDGSGSPQNLGANYASENFPEAVAVDPAAGKIYWTAGSAIRVGNLDGSGSPQNLGANYASETGPFGVAIDPAAGKIYWADSGSTSSNGAIRVGNLDGSGTPQNIATGESGPYTVALLRAPVPAGAPVVSGGSSTGSVLSCSRGVWAADLPGAQLYHAPQTLVYQWTRNGTLVPGASSSTLSASAAGQYVCYVGAVNHAGAAVQASAVHAITSGTITPTAKITKAKISSKHHKATFRFKAIGAATGFQCALVKRRKHHKPKPHFSRCKSPKTYKHLKAGKYTFELRALSAAGPGKPALKSFKIH